MIKIAAFRDSRDFLGGKYTHNSVSGSLRMDKESEGEAHRLPRVKCIPARRCVLNAPRFTTRLPIAGDAILNR